MKSITLPALPAITKVTEPGLYQPVITIILPFEPKMVPQEEIVDQLRAALETVHRHVAKSYQNDMGNLVMQKLRKVVRNLNFTTYSKSIAIFMSPLLEKVLYLDIPVEAKIVVDDPLDIRALVFAKKQKRQYLVMHINEYASNIYLGIENRLTRIKSNIPSSNHNNWVPPGKPNNSSEQRLKVILQCSDDGLAAISQAYPFPVLVVGSHKSVNYFKENTSRKSKILDYVYSNDDMMPEKVLPSIIKSIISDWDTLKSRYLAQQLECAKISQDIAIGIGNVWKMASKSTCSLLLVEDNYRHTEELLESEDGLYTSKEPYLKYSHIRNAVDYIIEIVLENGGDVEFVEKGFLKNYKDIALIRRNTNQTLFM